MSTGFAFIDKISQLAQLAAVSLDDAATQSVKAATKAAGIVIDDTATAPQYVTGLSPARELPIIGSIAWGSLKNKGIILGGIMGLSVGMTFAGLPVLTILTPLLMGGGAYLAYEGYEKAHELVHAFRHGKELEAENAISMTPDDAKKEEKSRITDAIRTDMILSGEIMTMAYAGVATASYFTQAATLFNVGVAMTVGVYGAVAGLVKMDDLGLAMAKAEKFHSVLHPLGRGIVKSMPKVFRGLEAAGAAAMLWVGGSMIAHGAAYFGYGGLAHGVEHVAEVVGHVATGVGAWATEAGLFAVLGTGIGLAIVKGVDAGKNLKGKFTAKKPEGARADISDVAPQNLAPIRAPKPERVCTINLEKAFAGSMLPSGASTISIAAIAHEKAAPSAAHSPN